MQSGQLNDQFVALICINAFLTEAWVSGILLTVPGIRLPCCKPVQDGRGLLGVARAALRGGNSARRSYVRHAPCLHPSLTANLCCCVCLACYNCQSHINLAVKTHQSDVSVSISCHTSHHLPGGGNTSHHMLVGDGKAITRTLLIAGVPAGLRTVIARCLLMERHRRDMGHAR